MNYIKRLENEKKNTSAELGGLKDGLHDLIRYLNSSKFHNDTTVQVSDILNRIGEIRNSSIDRMLEQQEKN